MKNSQFFFIALLLFSACTHERLAPANETVPPSGENVIPGTVVVKFSPEMTERIERGDTLPSDLGIVSVERVFPDAGEFEGRSRKAGLHQWYRVCYSESRPSTKAAEDMLLIPGVEISFAKKRIKNTAYVNDPYFSSMWHLYDGNTPTAGINVVPAWQSYTTGSDRIVVGVIDGGIQTDHPDLDGVVIPGGINGSRNFVNNGFNIVAHTHGTHVGGTIGAISNNGIGVAGIAGGDAASGIKGVRLLSCQIFMTVDGKDQGGDTAAAIKWAADHGATIINNSWGYSFDADNDGKLSGDELTKALNAKIEPDDKAAVDYFIANAGFDADGNQVGPMAGGVVFFSAGNDGIANGAPANYEPIVSVGATNSKLQRSSFSNYGEWVDISAPGEEIVSTYPTNAYARLQGTSMSCPHVTGAAALLLSYYGGKGFTNEQLKEKLIGGANYDALPAGSQIGPLLDVMGSFTYASSSAPAPVESAVVSATGNRLEFTFKVTGNAEGVPAYSYLVAASRNRSSVEAFDPFKAVPEDVTVATAYTGKAAVGEQMTAYVAGLEFEQQYYAVILSSSYHKKYSAASEVFEQKTYANNAPVIEAKQPGPYVVKASGELRIAFAMHDPEGHSINTSFEGGSSAADYSYDSANAILDIIIRGRRASAGTYTAKITVTDSYGASASSEVVYTILESAAPEVAKTPDNVLVYDKNSPIELDLAPLFSDPEGEGLTYKVRGNNPSLVKVDIKGSTLKISPQAYGLSSLSLVAVTPANKECSVPFAILVKNPDNVAESFPNPVIDKLTIRTEEKAETNVKLTNTNGVVIYEKTLEIGGFYPLVLDLSSCAPGKYHLSLSYSGKTYDRIIVKK